MKSDVCQTQNLDKSQKLLNGEVPHGQPVGFMKIYVGMVKCPLYGKMLNRTFAVICGRIWTFE